jgi:hypothetical protein
MAVLLGRTGRKLLDTRNKRASRINDLRRVYFELALDIRGHSMSTNDGSLAALYLNRIADRRHAVRAQSLHLLLIMDERAEAPNGVAMADRFFDHFDRPFDAETKSVLIC